MMSGCNSYNPEFDNKAISSLYPSLFLGGKYFLAQGIKCLGQTEFSESVKVLGEELYLGKQNIFPSHVEIFYTSDRT